MQRGNNEDDNDNNNKMDKIIVVIVAVSFMSMSLCERFVLGLLSSIQGTAYGTVISPRLITHRPAEIMLSLGVFRL